MEDPEFQREYDIFRYTVFAISVVSLISCLFVMLMYLLIKSLRNIAFRMIVYLQIADAIVAISLILEIFDPFHNQGVCYAQAFLINYGCDASFFCVCCIMTAIYRSATHKWRRVEPFEKYFLLLSFGFPLILTMMYR